MNLFEIYRSALGKVLIAMLVGAALLPGIAGAQSTTPIITGFLPTSVRAGSPAFTLNVLGAQFLPGAVVQWNGAGRATNFFNSTLLEANILTSDLLTGGTIQITVVNPGNVVSNVAIFTVTTGNPVPVLTGLSPSSMVAGGPDFSLSAFGSNFTAQSVVRWNGSNRPTIFVDGTTLTALISAADIAEPGTASITVLDSAPGGGTSAAKTFTISEFSSFYFPQVAVDGGYTTIITILNTGSESDHGFLTLTDQSGNPFTVTATPTSGAAVTNSVIPISVPAGGVRIFTLTTPGPGGATPKAGWARLDAANNLLSGVAAFQTMQGAVLTSIAGVLPAVPENSVTIPVDNNLVIGRRTGFAIANPDTDTLNYRIIVQDAEGSQVGDPIRLSLEAHKQIARFLDEFVSLGAGFKGSMTIVGDSLGDEFVSVALLLNPGPTAQGLMSVIPVIPVVRSNAP
jgi:hypothetical protein